MEKTPRVLAFDLDDTLAPSKSPVVPDMAAALARLLDRYDVCVISGGSFDQFRMQLIERLDVPDAALRRLHIMPTCGTRYYHYESDGWREIYAENLTDAERRRIIEVLGRGIDALGLRESVTYGDVIEDRGSQITFSALGQDIAAELGEKGVHLKAAWDPDHTKKHALRDYVAARLPEFEVRVGGGTSVDITRPGIDKAYGISKLMDMLEVGKDELVFFGDRLDEGGNDYPVRSTGVRTIAVTGWPDTLRKLERYIK